MRKGEPQSTTVARKRERVQNGARSSGIINVTVGGPQTDGDGGAHTSEQPLIARGPFRADKEKGFVRVRPSGKKR